MKVTRTRICWVSALLLGFSISAEPPQANESAPLGQAADWALEEPEATLVTLQAGSLLRTEPALEAEILQTLPEVQLELLEWRETWAKVRFGAEVGWVDVDRAPSGGYLPEAAEPRKIALTADPILLQRALQLLSPDHDVRKMGSFTLYSDVGQPELLQELDELAHQIEKLFIERFGLVPIEAEDRGAVVLYRRQAAYQEFNHAHRSSWRDRQSSAHAVPGLAVLHAELKQRTDLQATVVHELTHLLTWQAFGRLLPWWLEEGLAEDLTLSRVEKGRLKATPLSRTNLRYGDTLGAVIAELYRVLESEDLPAMPALLTGEPIDISKPDDVSLLYGQVGCWIRFLLERSQADRAAGFRSFLVAVATGAEPDAQILLSHLGASQEDLMLDFESWLQRNKRFFATRSYVVTRKRPVGLFLDEDSGGL